MERVIDKELILAAKLLEIRTLVVSLNKGERNEHFKFDYVSSNQVLSAVRSEMDRLQLLLIPSIEKTNMVMDGNKIITELWLVYSWYDVEHGHQWFSCNWYAQGVDSGEKGVGKALTYAEKYFLLKFFNIATDADDPDGSNVTVTNTPNRKTKPPKSDSNGTSPQMRVIAYLKDISDSKAIMFLKEKKMLEDGQDLNDLSTKHCDLILDPSNEFIRRVKDYTEIDI